MKKTLIALAAVAAASASYAQVSLSGEFAYGYLATTNGAGASSSGGGLDTALLTFAAGEDLGGGNRVDVTMKTDGTNGRGGNLANDDQVIELTTSFAKFKAGSWKPGDWLTGYTGGATWYGLDGKVLSSRSYRDSIGVSIPMGNGLALSATVYEPANVLGEGGGNAGTSAQGNNVYTLTYAAGPMMLAAGYVTYSNVGATDATANTVTRFAGNYNLGAAKVGAGIQTANYAGGATGTQTTVSVSGSLGGNLSANAQWASNKMDAAATSVQAPANGTRSGYVVGLQYNLSKQTYAILNYGNYQAAMSDAQNANFSALTLVKDF